MNAAEFAAKWRGITTSERASAQTHFNDLCQMLGVPAPLEADPEGRWYAFEKGAEKLGGGDGWADVWKRGFFGWEYKGKHANLEAAYAQLQQYRESLENPPLLVVCDLDRFEVHTNFYSTAKEIHRFSLEDLATNAAEPLRVLRAVFADPEALRPHQRLRHHRLPRQPKCLRQQPRRPQPQRRPLSQHPRRRQLPPARPAQTSPRAT